MLGDCGRLRVGLVCAALRPTGIGKADARLRTARRRSCGVPSLRMHTWYGGVLCVCLALVLALFSLVVPKGQLRLLGWSTAKQSTLQRSAARGNAAQHVATQRSTLQRSATPYKP